MKHKVLLLVSTLLMINIPAWGEIKLTNSDREQLEQITRSVFDSYAEEFNQSKTAKEYAKVLNMRKIPEKRLVELFNKTKIERKRNSLHIAIDEHEIEMEAVDILANRYNINGEPWTFDSSAPEKLQIELLSRRIIETLEKKPTRGASLILLFITPSYAAGPLLIPVAVLARAALPAAGRLAVSGAKWAYNGGKAVIMNQFAMGVAVSTVGMGVAVPLVKCKTLGGGPDCAKISEVELDKLELVEPDAEKYLNERIDFKTCADGKIPLRYIFTLQINGTSFQIERTVHFTKNEGEEKPVPTKMEDKFYTADMKPFSIPPIKYEFVDGILTTVRATDKARDTVVVEPTSAEPQAAESKETAIMRTAANAYAGYDVKAAVIAQKFCKSLSELREGKSGPQRDPAVGDALEKAEEEADAAVR